MSRLLHPLLYHLPKLKSLKKDVPKMKSIKYAVLALVVVGLSIPATASAGCGRSACGAQPVRRVVSRVAKVRPLRALASIRIFGRHHGPRGSGR